ncbi:V-type ATPase subunit [Ruminococcaceae bacterium OttesenSCG-928-D13]|nr:V-type ATPase subunit [Ruminococcaceae bacterium OttesenSCG-928-D13]
MQATATQAMIPKARGMYAKRISAAEYEEMMRRRTVPELAALLKRHPYFSGSLATLSTTGPHRGQIEELLNMDIFQKYESLVKYDFSGDGFSRVYLAECELRELLKALHLISIGLLGAYLQQMPAYLVGKTEIDLFALSRARSLKDVVEVTARTPYHRPLRARWLADPTLRDFPMTEAALLKAYYAMVFELIDRSLTGRDAQSTEELYRQEAEIYNLELLLRVKAFFPKVYSPDEIRQLLLPYSHRMPKRRLDALIETDSREVALQLLRQAGFLTVEAPEDIPLAGGQRIYVFARRSLHLTASPVAALAAFLSLAKLERENVVNVVEGVRYNLPPEKIRPLLHV